MGEVNVTAGATTSGVNAELSAAGIIAGTVTAAATKEPVSGASVAVYAHGSAKREAVGARGITAETGVIIGTATAGSDGKYEVRNLPSGEYLVGFEAPTAANLLPQYHPNTAQLGEAVPVAVTAGATTAAVNAALLAGWRITGTVRDAPPTRRRMSLSAQRRRPRRSQPCSRRARQRSGRPLTTRRLTGRARSGQASRSRPPT